ncbi:MAG: thioredoxin family protein [Bacteroidota bacterium]
MRLFIPLLISLFTLVASPVLAQDEAVEDSSPYSSARLISEVTSIQPGVPFTLGLHLEMDPGWHSYWLNPGDSGEPTEIVWDLPATFSTDAIQWPIPHKIDLPPLRTYGYENEVTLLTAITPPADLATGSKIEITATVYWLICEEICLPAEEAVSIQLPVEAATPTSSADAPLFNTARNQLPVSDESWDVAATSTTGSYVLRVVPPSAFEGNWEDVHFFSSAQSVVEHAAPQPVTRDGNAYLIGLQQSEYAGGLTEQLTGVLINKSADNTLALAVDIPVQDQQGFAAAAAEPATQALLPLLLLALAGGLLLNLMPCVFPVLSLKVLGFAQQTDSSPTDIRKHGWFFAFGVVASFWVLAGLLLALRAAGSQVGWGFQLQSPLFIAGMTALFFVIGLNLLGVFEIGLFTTRLGNLSRGSGHQRAFFDGILATLVATPCTAPFMGAALGAAIVLPTAEGLLIFTALGIGMALPYVLLSNMPNLVKRLPKPGAWMETLKQVLAFPMLATAIWLIWVFGKQTGTDGITLLLLGLLLLGAACWVLGKWPAIQISTRTRLWSRAGASALTLLAMAAVFTGAASQADLTSVETASVKSGWQPFSVTAVAALREQGQPVFIDFTAAWCLTCQVNKRTTLNATAVQDAFRKKGVTIFQADWTNEDPEITQALEALGRNGVPVYALYTGKNAAPVLLPEILNESIILDALSALPDRAGASL